MLKNTCTCEPKRNTCIEFHQHLIELIVNNFRIDGYDAKRCIMATCVYETGDVKQIGSNIVNGFFLSLK